jgi:F0F1-type ATP synthase membrane subunit b/b'
MKRSDADGIDAEAVTATAERALAALSDERKIKNQLTGIKTGADKAYALVEEMSARVRGLLEEIDSLVRPADAEAAALRDDQLEL